MQTRFAHVNFALAQHAVRSDSSRFCSKVLVTVCDTVIHCSPGSVSFKAETELLAFITRTLSKRSLTRLTTDTVAALMSPANINHNLHGPPVDVDDLWNCLLVRIPRGPMRQVAMAFRHGTEWADLCRVPALVPALDQIDDGIRIEAMKWLDEWQLIADSPELAASLPAGATTMMPLHAVRPGGAALAKKSLISSDGRTVLQPDDNDLDRLAHRALLNAIVDRISRLCPEAYQAAAEKL